MKKRIRLKFSFGLFVFMVTICFSQTALMGQDTIIKRNNEKIIGKVIEINLNELKYQRVDLPNGPIYILPKEMMNAVVYANGVKEDFSTFEKRKELPLMSQPDLSIQPANGLFLYKGHLISEMDMLDIAWAQKDKKINLFVNRTEHERVVKKLFFLGGVTLATVSLINLTGIFDLYATSTQISTSGSRNHSYSQTLRNRRMERLRVSSDLMIGALACSAVSVVYKIKERKSARLVVSLYNQNLIK